MRLGLAILAVLYACAFACAPAVAACYGVNSKTKQRQSVHEIYRASSHPKRYFAQATHDARTGRPQIIYYRRYSAAPGHFKRFVRHHECCHHLGNRNEIAANLLRAAAHALVLQRPGGAAPLHHLARRQ